MFLTPRYATPERFDSLNSCATELIDIKKFKSIFESIPLIVEAHELKRLFGALSLLRSHLHSTANFHGYGNRVVR